MTAFSGAIACALAAFVALAPAGARAADAAPPPGSAAPDRAAPADTTLGGAADTLTASDRAADSLEAAADARDRAAHPPLEALVPDLAAHPYRIEPGPRDFSHVLSLGPAFGFLGSEHLFAFRATYNPNSWFGYEASLGHNPGQAVHALLHTLSAIVRRPLSGRFQPYLSAGFGMVMVSPGQATNASPVTKNTVTVGGGFEFFIRNDLALRADARQATILGQLRDQAGIVAYNYAEGTIGLAFNRRIRP
jgi:opacity protein-like surface antigen